MTTNWKVKPRGREDAPYVIVGDAPKPNEVDSGLALDGDTYDLLVDFLNEAGIDYKDVVFVNATQLSKRGGVLAAKDIIADAEVNLLPFIRAHERKIVIPLGNNALCATGVTKKPEKITSLKGTKCKSDLLPGQMLVPAIHPYSIQKEPELVDELMYLFNFAARVAKDPNAPDQVAIKIIDIVEPAQIKELVKCCKRDVYCAYDFETTGLDQRRDFPVTAAFCTGEYGSDGRLLVWFWVGYDALVPLYTNEELNAFIDEFEILFRNSGQDYHMVAWNKAFDDWMAETWIGVDFQGSDYDAMIMKWNVNSRRPHDLKNATAMYCGFSNYDKPVDDAVKEIAERRAKILTHEDDFRCLKLFNYDPIVAKTGFKWTKDVDKKLCAYALVPFDTLRLYNALDAAYTFLLFKKFQTTIKRENLSKSCAFRHRVSYELLAAEKRGMELDVEMNRRFSKELGIISDRCQKQIVDALAERGLDLPDFNPGSGDQLGEVLFGAPSVIPMVSVDALIDKYGWDEKVAQDRCAIIQEQFYGDCKWLKEQMEYKIYDYKDCAIKLQELFNKRYGFNPDVEEAWVYLHGLYEPEVFTKTGKPSTANAILVSIYEKDKHPFLSLILLKRKADKLKSTFVDAIHTKRGSDDCVRARYNVIGTDSGRISSSGPNCFHPSTELLTDVGWKAVHNITELHKVAQYNKDTHVISFVHPTNTYKRKFVGKLVHAYNQQIEFCVTPDHRTLVTNRKTLTCKDVLAKDFPKNGLIRHTGEFVGGMLDVNPDLVRFSIAYQADSTLRKCGITVFEFSKERKIARMRELLNRLQVVFSEGVKNKKTGKTVTFNIRRENMPELILVTADRKFTHDVFRLTRELMGVFESEIWLWDGFAKKNTSYASAYKNNADIVQAVCLLTGRRAKVRKYSYKTQDGAIRASWQVDASNNQYSQITNISVDNEDYDGNVYCLSVPDSYVVSRIESKKDGGYRTCIIGQCQNFPPYMRGQLRARKGYKLLEFDLSQAEIRVVAAYSGDINLLKALENEDVDVHSSIAAGIYSCDPSEVTKEQRRFTKTIVFGLIYGRGSWAMGVALGISQEEAQEFIDLFFSTYPDLKAWLDNQVKIAKRAPYYVYTPWGTRRSTKNVLSTDKKEVSHTERIAKNMPIQGAAGELTLYYICEIMDRCREGDYGVFMVNTTHDSVTFEVPEHLVWQEVVDKQGDKNVYCIKGPIADIVREVIATTAPVSPLDRVKFKADMELNDRWSGEPDLLRSIDPEKGGEKSIFRWDIIKSDEVMDREELEEFNELLDKAGEL